MRIQIPRYALHAGFAARAAGYALSIVIAAIIATPPALASSHREAPFITKMPKVDATDLYMFRSYETGRADFVTLIANYIPFQDPPGGPNFYQMDENAIYEIHIDNVGDGNEHLTFQFRFKNELKDQQLGVGDKSVSIPLINKGPIDSVNSPNLNVRETYSVFVTRGNRRFDFNAAQIITNAAGGASVFDKPVDNIGNKSIPDYAAYAAQHIYNINIPGCTTRGRMFVGQRKESFVINVGEALDLINIQAPAIEFDPNAISAARDDLAGKNITSIELEVPIACLTNGTEPVIGAWTTASLRQGRLLNPTPAAGLNNASKEGGPWTQISRLGMPLVNELVIGLKDKDRFNASEPANDAQFINYVTNPTLSALVETLFSSAGVRAPTKFPRNDLVTTFLTGVPGVNQPANVVASEMLRLNTATAPVAKGAQRRLGVIDGDNAGFPNGRRPGDDVVDIELRVVMGKLCTLNIGACTSADAPSGSISFTDGAYVDDSFFDAAFPYLRTPLPGSPQSARP